MLSLLTLTIENLGILRVFTVILKQSLNHNHGSFSSVLALSFVSNGSVAKILMKFHIILKRQDLKEVITKSLFQNIPQ